MFDKLLEFVHDLGGQFMPFEVVDAYEAGVVLRFGRYHRPAPSGLVWKWPWAERVLTSKTCVTTLRLPPQTLTTADREQVLVTAIVKYEIADPRAFLLDVWDATDVLSDATAGAVRRAVEGRRFDDLLADKWEREVLERVRAEVARYGFRILRVTYADLGRVRALRLVMPSNSMIVERHE